MTRSMTKKKIPSGTSFGKFAEEYQKGRKEYPSYLFSFLKNLCPTAEYILDIGCGTGIATRMLSKIFSHVFACDVDEWMIHVAKKISTPTISYAVSDVTHMPYEDESFDLVTAFACLHWFCTPEALKEIKRVLRKDGFFCAVNKIEMGTFRSDLQKIIENVMGISIENTKLNFDPKTTLMSNCFPSCVEYSWDLVEEYTFDETHHYIQSLSVWDFVTDEKRDEVFKKLTEFLQMKFSDNIAKRPIRFSCIIGYE